MHASESHLGNDITESYIASFAHGNPGEFITPPFYGFTFFFLNVFGVERHAHFAKTKKVFGDQELHIFYTYTFC
ncbi:hypothetical protein Hanom_Chr04g00347561 [Helianthus anomalus]